MRCYLFFLFIFMFAFATEVTCEYIDDRQKVPNELLEVNFDKGMLYLKGWAFIRDYQNYYDASTHSFRLHVKGPSHKVFQMSLDSVNLTRFMSYRGYRLCEDNQISQESCNHHYENVGFYGSIPLNTLIEGDYALSLEIHHQQTHRTVEVPLYLTSMKSLSHQYDGKDYSIDSVFKQGGITVYYHTLIATATPFPSYEGKVVEYGQYCSRSHGNTSFYRQGAMFQKIKDVVKYKGIVSYFKVGAKQSGCVDGRQRLVEGNEVTVYIPSTFVNYTGGNLKLKIRNRMPKLDAQPISINQYQPYDVFENVSAVDYDHNNISDRIEVTSNNVNVRIPGTYNTCYSVTDYRNQRATSCRKVFVETIPTFFRYISELSIPEAHLNIWNNNLFHQVLKDALLRRQTYIKKSY
ncbi:DUF5011 domain-containing protein [Erysipelothrix amsterdamensis]|uniref:DUF5011 domain-containing protein n=1 Tax=Erysipelothrix amsterdamensis TaxID=2929157 RepID=A0AAU9VGY8_9FIRM|nr:DUF5011 domain-containing protein [Erysipelothrix sp. A18Y020d]CAH2762660.1 DUF5011 domain-containing protein [Erysipelothrix sp. A18Y020d]